MAGSELPRGRCWGGEREQPLGSFVVTRFFFFLVVVVGSVGVVGVVDVVGDVAGVATFVDETFANQYIFVS